MYTEADITAAAGAAGLKYALNKNRGGRSSAQGRDFETVYGAYRIALDAAEALRSGASGTDISYHDQLLCFIDDFVVSRPDGRTLAQLKSGGAAWNVGNHPLADDFRMQARLDASCNTSARYELVVGDDERRDLLEADRPADLASVSVLSFPGGSSDIELIGQLADLAAALDELSPRSAERIVRQQVWRMLLGTWQGTRGDQTLADVVNAASEGPGGVVAPLLPSYVLSDAAQKALDKVDGLRFNIEKNFFVYGALDGVMQGTAEFHCHTPQFEAFVADLINSQPTDFLSFWFLMRAHI